MANKNPLISVIMPCYNSSRFIARAIFSVLNQTYKNLELIIVDDCSIDDTKKIIKKFLKQDKRIKFYSTKKNSKLAAAPRNLGISKASGKFIAFLDSDDYWQKDKLTYQIKYISNFNFSFTAANYQSEGSDKKSNFLITYFRIFLQFLFLFLIKIKGYHWLYVYNPFLISSALLTTKLVKNLKFDESKNKREDLTYWLELFKKVKTNFIFHPKVFLTISRSKYSVTSNKVKEFNKIINTIADNILINRLYDKYYFFMIGIFLRVAKLLISKIYSVLRRSIIYIIFMVSVIYFTIFYTPLFWYAGNNLIYFNEQKKTEAVFVLSGHKGFTYWNNSYQERFFDIKYWADKYGVEKNTKFYLLGKLQAIPEQKVLEALMLSENIDQSNINVIYKEYKNSAFALDLLMQELDKKKFSSVTIITSPYHSLRLSILWKEMNNNKYETVFFKNVNLAKKNNFFQRSYNKKEIIYEYLANIYYFSKLNK
jgi:teichuronic acid biosynthesis glycosyltransferase TuaG